jgi:hypothetical protein
VPRSDQRRIDIHPAAMSYGAIADRLPFSSMAKRSR